MKGSGGATDANALGFDPSSFDAPNYVPLGARIADESDDDADFYVPKQTTIDIEHFDNP